MHTGFRLRPPEALLRFTVLAQVDSLVLGGLEVSAAVREVAGREHAYLDGRPVQVSERTIQRWRGAYATGGVAALEPRSRKRIETSLALSEVLLAFLQAEKKRDPRASVPELLRLARERGIVAEQPNRTTAWRA